jgi:methylthioribose-1-phosphate isomerase
LQGSRLTAWELANEGIPVTLNADSAGAHHENQGRYLGDRRRRPHHRQWRRGNKIGTYQLAVNAMHHGVFMVVAPSSTIDMSLASGDDIPIEERDAGELLEVAGKRVGADVEAFNPVFDVTPADLIDVIVTEKGHRRAPGQTAKLAQLMPDSH